MTGETLGIILASIGAAEVIRIVVSKIFSKRADKIFENKDEFATLRDRMLFNEKQTNRLNRELSRTNMKILKMYTILTELTKKSCGKDCPMREIVAIDISELSDDKDEPFDDDPPAEQYEQS